MTLLIFLALLSAHPVPCLLSDSLTFLAVGDWGGKPTAPYTTEAETKTASSMGITAEKLESSFQLSLGDNFYYYGVKNVEDERFNETFENVFTASSLQSPWLISLGNHDHYGNESAQIAYTNVSKRWYLPNNYYTKTYPIDESGHTLQLVVIDTILLAGLTDPILRYLPPPGPLSVDQADEQWTWIEKTLTESNATWLLVAGHYPVWSICEHGPTDILVSRLKPMLEKYNASAYLCGHDHCMEHIHDGSNPVNYYLIGAGHLTDSSEDHMKDIPKGSLVYHYGPSDPEDDHGSYASVSVTSEQMKIVFYDSSDQHVLYENVQSNPRN
ncbi:tartrate-resistant acid phosphatase type 5-like [Oscarella lobularis]|uniref:tartrate-resistant acid phosphatase type 5-like n=1 Tax=Oscarella lobularis TaxID=121494 RepID=UPI003313147A